VEEIGVTIRNWVRFFLHTLFIGGITAGIMGFIIRWHEFAPLFQKGDVLNILSVFIWLVGVGFTFSVISQMGYFAYLTIHQFGLRMFRSSSLWNAVQMILVAFVLFDLVYFRFQAFADKGESLIPYFGLAAFLLAFAVVVAWIKTKQSNKKMFASALFFMVVATVLEWLPVLTVNEKSWLYLMLFALLFCNAYQLLLLPKYIERSKEENSRNKKTPVYPPNEKNRTSTQ
jgi:KinB signaling pathway activation protein